MMKKKVHMSAYSQAYWLLMDYIVVVIFLLAIIWFGMAAQIGSEILSMIWR